MFSSFFELKCHLVLVTGLFYNYLMDIYKAHSIVVYLCPYNLKIEIAIHILYNTNFLEKSWFCRERELSSFTDRTHIF